MTSEFDGREGPVREAIAHANDAWRQYLATGIVVEVKRGELSSDADPDLVIFELTGLMMSLNHFLQLTHDATTVQRARVGLARLLQSSATEVASEDRDPRNGQSSAGTAATRG